LRLYFEKSTYGYNKWKIKTTGKKPFMKLTQKLNINKILSAKEAAIVQPVSVGETILENELVFFIKPELLDVSNEKRIQNSLDLIQSQFEAFDVQVDGIVIVPGPVLEKHEIMNRHYGFINQLSRKASRLIEPETRQRLFEMLSLDEGDHPMILGGHEFLTYFDTDIPTLSEVWFAQEAKKLRSGFYFIKDTVQGETIILVNGFHPSQLAHFTREDHQIILMLLHTNTDWEKMKFVLVGDTFPERASPDSIRGQLYQDPDNFGMDEVGINTNGVHLSAGPFEAAFEVVNFFGPMLNLDPSEQPPLILKRLLKKGITKEAALALLDNPDVNDSDLFTETENMNTEQAAAFVMAEVDL
jgi:hypothetical protein